MLCHEGLKDSDHERLATSVLEMASMTKAFKMHVMVGSETTGCQTTYDNNRSLTEERKHSSVNYKLARRRALPNRAINNAPPEQHKQ
jgi:hypothetical protein